ncbi:hypothetical protein [Variovorax guangxiensis]|nr:hypothetical protein [Variovorax guangxiensis]
MQTIELREFVDSRGEHLAQPRDGGRIGAIVLDALDALDHADQHRYRPS